MEKNTLPAYVTPRLKDNPNFLELSYGELEERNLTIRKERASGKTQEHFRKKFLETLEKEPGIKAVTVCFSDMEGKLHMLDYNKKYLLDSYGNLTFDGSSIRGFTAQKSSDLRLALDWSTFRWLPSDIFGHGKVILFANVCNQDGTPYHGDYRSNLVGLAENLKKKQGYVINVAPEIEGFLLAGENAEQVFDEKTGFELASKGGYFNALPQDSLRQFIDRLAEATRALAFENEKDHPEVAPSQFETNYKYTDVVEASDQILLYKVLARQIAKNFGSTACFLPKPIMKINGSGMHTNISLSKNGKNLFYDKNGKYHFSRNGHDFLTGILYFANDLCLAINSSVNAYRRLDPRFEAPNEIKVSPSDRGAMIRIPIGNEKSARIEVRTVAPDANPYLCYFLLIKAGLKGMNAKAPEKKTYYGLYDKPVKKLPGHIYEAIAAFKKSDFIAKTLGEENRDKFLALKEAAAGRCARELGTRVKAGEVWYHHEVTNQVLWNKF
ncbi:glutamine synthetase [Candidatus Peregrinibacteria bacterium]|nr:glutamine synthetase [Candidatus Peregrinibacteria bacterium]